jgi:hypothetical protein
MKLTPKVIKLEKEGSNLFSKPSYIFPSFFGPSFLFLVSPFDADHIGTLYLCLETRSWERTECECFSVSVCLRDRVNVLLGRFHQTFFRQAKSRQLTVLGEKFVLKFHQQLTLLEK